MDLRKLSAIFATSFSEYQNYTAQRVAGNVAQMPQVVGTKLTTLLENEKKEEIINEGVRDREKAASGPLTQLFYYGLGDAYRSISATVSSVKAQVTATVTQYAIDVEKDKKLLKLSQDTVAQLNAANSEEVFVSILMNALSELKIIRGDKSEFGSFEQALINAFTRLDNNAELKNSSLRSKMADVIRYISVKNIRGEHSDIGVPISFDGKFVKSFFENLKITIKKQEKFYDFDTPEYTSIAKKLLYAKSLADFAQALGVLLKQSNEDAKGFLSTGIGASKPSAQPFIIAALQACKSNYPQVVDDLLKTPELSEVNKAINVSKAPPSPPKSAPASPTSSSVKKATPLEAPKASLYTLNQLSDISNTKVINTIGVNFNNAVDVYETNLTRGPSYSAGISEITQNAKARSNYTLHAMTELPANATDKNPRITMVDDQLCFEASWIRGRVVLSDKEAADIEGLAFAIEKFKKDPSNYEPLKPFLAGFNRFLEKADFSPTLSPNVGLPAKHLFVAITEQGTLKLKADFLNKGPHYELTKEQIDDIEKEKPGLKAAIANNDIESLQPFVVSFMEQLKKYKLQPGSFQELAPDQLKLAKLGTLIPASQARLYCTNLVNRTYVKEVNNNYVKSALEQYLKKFEETLAAYNQSKTLVSSKLKNVVTGNATELELEYRLMEQWKYAQELYKNHRDDYGVVFPYDEGSSQSIQMKQLVNQNKNFSSIKSEVKTSEIAQYNVVKNNIKTALKMIDDNTKNAIDIKSGSGTHLASYSAADLEIVAGNHLFLNMVGNEVKSDTSNQAADLKKQAALLTKDFLEKIKLALNGTNALKQQYSAVQFLAHNKLALTCPGYTLNIVENQADFDALQKNPKQTYLIKDSLNLYQTDAQGELRAFKNAKAVIEPLTFNDTGELTSDSVLKLNQELQENNAYSTSDVALSSLLNVQFGELQEKPTDFFVENLSVQSFYQNIAIPHCSFSMAVYFILQHGQLEQQLELNALLGVHKATYSAFSYDNNYALFLPTAIAGRANTLLATANNPATNRTDPEDIKDLLRQLSTVFITAAQCVANNSYDVTVVKLIATLPTTIETLKKNLAGHKYQLRADALMTGLIEAIEVQEKALYQNLAKGLAAKYQGIDKSSANQVANIDATMGQANTFIGLYGDAQTKQEYFARTVTSILDEPLSFRERRILIQNASSALQLKPDAELATTIIENFRNKFTSGEPVDQKFLIYFLGLISEIEDQSEKTKRYSDLIDDILVLPNLSLDETMSLICEVDNAAGSLLDDNTTQQIVNFMQAKFASENRISDNFLAYLSSLLNREENLEIKSLKFTALVTSILEGDRDISDKMEFIQKMSSSLGVSIESSTKQFLVERVLKAYENDDRMESVFSEAFYGVINSLENFENKNNFIKQYKGIIEKYCKNIFKYANSAEDAVEKLQYLYTNINNLITAIPELEDLRQKPSELYLIDIYSKDRVSNAAQRIMTTQNSNFVERFGRAYKAVISNRMFGEDLAILNTSQQAQYRSNMRMASEIMLNAYIDSLKKASAAIDYESSYENKPMSVLADALPQANILYMEVRDGVVFYKTNRTYKEERLTKEDLLKVVDESTADFIIGSVEKGSILFSFSVDQILSILIDRGHAQKSISDDLDNLLRQNVYPGCTKMSFIEDQIALHIAKRDFSGARSLVNQYFAVQGYEYDADVADKTRLIDIINAVEKKNYALANGSIDNLNVDLAFKNLLTFAVKDQNFSSKNFKSLVETSRKTNMADKNAYFWIVNDSAEVMFENKNLYETKQHEYQSHINGLSDYLVQQVRLLELYVKNDLKDRNQQTDPRVLGANKIISSMNDLIINIADKQGEFDPDAMNALFEAIKEVRQGIESEASNWTITAAKNSRLYNNLGDILIALENKKETLKVLHSDVKSYGKDFFATLNVDAHVTSFINLDYSTISYEEAAVSEARMLACAEYLNESEYNDIKQKISSKLDAFYDALKLKEDSLKTARAVFCSPQNLVSVLNVLFTLGNRGEKGNESYKALYQLYVNLLKSAAGVYDVSALEKTAIASIDDRDAIANAMMAFSLKNITEYVNNSNEQGLSALPQQTRLPPVFTTQVLAWLTKALTVPATLSEAERGVLLSNAFSMLNTLVTLGELGNEFKAKFAQIITQGMQSGLIHAVPNQAVVQENISKFFEQVKFDIPEASETGIENSSQLFQNYQQSAESYLAYQEVIKSLESFEGFLKQNKNVTESGVFSRFITDKLAALKSPNRLGLNSNNSSMLHQLIDELKNLYSNNIILRATELNPFMDKSIPDAIAKADWAVKRFLATQPQMSQEVSKLRSDLTQALTSVRNQVNTTNTNAPEKNTIHDLKKSHFVALVQRKINALVDAIAKTPESKEKLLLEFFKDVLVAKENLIRTLDDQNFLKLLEGRDGLIRKINLSIANEFSVDEQDRIKTRLSAVEDEHNHSVSISRTSSIETTTTPIANIPVNLDDPKSILLNELNSFKALLKPMTDALRQDMNNRRTLFDLDKIKKATGSELLNEVASTLSAIEATIEQYSSINPSEFYVAIYSRVSALEKLFGDAQNLDGDKENSGFKALLEPIVILLSKETHKLKGRFNLSEAISKDSKDEVLAIANYAVISLIDGVKKKVQENLLSSDSDADSSVFNTNISQLVKGLIAPDAKVSVSDLATYCLGFIENRGLSLPSVAGELKIIETLYSEAQKSAALKADVPVLGVPSAAIENQAAKELIRVIQEQISLISNYSKMGLWNVQEKTLARDDFSRLLEINNTLPEDLSDFIQKLVDVNDSLEKKVKGTSLSKDHFVPAITNIRVAVKVYQDQLQVNTQNSAVITVNTNLGNSDPDDLPIKNDDSQVKLTKANDKVASHVTYPIQIVDANGNRIPPNSAANAASSVHIGGISPSRHDGSPGNGLLDNDFVHAVTTGLKEIAVEAFTSVAALFKITPMLQKCLGVFVVYLSGAVLPYVIAGVRVVALTHA